MATWRGPRADRRSTTPPGPAYAGPGRGRELGVARVAGGGWLGTSRGGLARGGRRRSGADGRPGVGRRLVRIDTADLGRPVGPSGPDLGSLIGPKSHGRRGGRSGATRAPAGGGRQAGWRQRAARPGSRAPSDGEWR